MQMKLTFSPLLAVLIIILAGCTSGQTVSIKDLRVEMKENPVGIGVSQPRFMWKISSGSPDLTQTSYQIQVAESPDNLKNGKELLWDSGESRLNGLESDKHLVDDLAQSFRLESNLDRRKQSFQPRGDERREDTSCRSLSPQRVCCG